MYLFTFTTISLLLFANKDEIRSLYPQIWIELESIGYNYNQKVKHSISNQQYCFEFCIEKKEEITYNKSSTRKDS